MIKIISVLILCACWGGIFSTAFSAAEEETVAQSNVAQPKKRLILYAGQWKTGSSSIDYSLNKNRTQLAKQGVFYGNQTKPWSKTYKARSMSGIYSITEADIQALYKYMTVHNHHTVILMNENAFGYGLDGEKVNTFYDYVSQYFHLEITLTVREIYGWCWSLYWEQLKWRENDLDFKSHVETKTDHFLRFDTAQLLSKTKAGPPCVVNYDAHKKDLFPHLINIWGLPITDLNLEPVMANPSLTLSQMNLVEILRCQKMGIGHWRKAELTKAFRKNGKSGPSFKWYNESIAEIAYKRFAPQIAYLNTLLPSEEQLPTTAHLPLGYTTEWDQKIFEPQDLKALLLVIKEFGLTEYHR